MNNVLVKQVGMLSRNGLRLVKQCFSPSRGGVVKISLTFSIIFFWIVGATAQGYDAQMAVTATASKLNPKSGEAFEFNIVMGSQGLGSTASIISNAGVDFILPPHLDVVATPVVDADAFIIT
ncbi:MAG: hypothetical protein LBR84_06925, partial [Tannerella sp.]|nr:hypothetical protein [Tannerella sp.]